MKTFKILALYFCYCTNNLLKCELSGCAAVKFYNSFKEYRGNVIICVIRRDIVDVFQSSSSIFFFFGFIRFICTFIMSLFFGRLAGFVLRS